MEGIVQVELKATLIACIFTLISGISGAYVVVKINDAEANIRIDHLSGRADKFQEILEGHDELLHKFRVHMEKSSIYLDRSLQSNARLNESVDKLTGKIECLSTTIARVDERLKHVEGINSEE